MDRSLPRRVAVIFLPMAVTLCLAAAFTFVVIQQDLRMGANDEPQRLAEDAVRALDAGIAPATVVGATVIPVDTSLSPFALIFDATGRLLATSGSIDGAQPAVPPGVLLSAREQGRDAVTWQPRTGVRIAAVALPWRGGTVLAGQSLRLVEAHIDAIERLVGLALIVGLVVQAALAIVVASIWGPRGT